MNEDQRLHLQFIQNVITRMNANSFQVKTWTVSIIVALAALAVNSKNYMYILISVVPTILFWTLDSYYLQQERKFRGLYKDVVLGNVPLYLMQINRYREGIYQFSSALFSNSIIKFYGAILASILLATFIA
jgi:hypothetical protein